MCLRTILRRVALLQYYLSTVNFLRQEEGKKGKRKEICVYVIEQEKQIEDQGSKVAEAFYQAAYLTKQLLDEEQAKESKLTNFCSDNARAVELQFRATNLSGHIINLTIEFNPLKVAISSYYWRRKNRSYIKCEDNKKVDSTIVLDLLSRIYIKKDNRILHLTHGNFPIKKRI